MLPIPASIDNKSLSSMEHENDQQIADSLFENPSRLRDLGAFEHFRVVLHDLGFHYNVALVAKLTGPESSGKARHQLILSALREAIQEHPALSSAVAGKETEKPFFTRIEKIDLSKIILFEILPSDDVEESKRVDEVLSQQHSTAFVADDLPLWRVVVFERQAPQATPTIHLAFIWHHVIRDGKSGLAVLSTILQALNSTHHQKQNVQLDVASRGAKDATTLALPNSATVMTPSKPLYPALEEILSLPVSNMAARSQGLRPWLPPWLNKETPPRKWSGSPYHCEKSIKTSIRHLRLSATTSQGLVDHCRSEQTTITPFLQALVGSVIMETFQDAEWLRCAVAVSLRRFFPAHMQIDDSVMGLWVNAFHLDYTRSQLEGQDDDPLLWSQARKNSQRIDYEVGKGEMDIEIGMLKHSADFKSVLMAKVGREREDSYAITNIGAFDAKIDSMHSSSSLWQLSDLVFSQSCHVNGSALQFCIVTLKGGDMCIALSWQEETVASEDVACIAENLRRKLLLLGNTPDVEDEDSRAKKDGGLVVPH